MKKTVGIIFIAILSLPVFCQNITGEWNGVLKVPGQSLRLVFHIQKTDSGYTATMDSPDQSVYGIPVTETSFEENNFTINIKNAIQYMGTFHNDTISGLFKQNGAVIPLKLYRGEVSIAKPKRPQEPKKPYPYDEEEVKFDNPSASGVTLAGTLTIPSGEGKFSAVILVSGSGAQNRDEEIFGHKPFLVISDYLTRHGFAVLRYDDRGTAGSTGVYDTCSTYDFSTDAEAAFKYLQGRKEINPKQIGFIGHSEGGIIAPLVAAHNKNVAFLILLAAPGIRGDSLLLVQTKLFLKTKNGITDQEIGEALRIKKSQDSIIYHTEDTQEMKDALTAFFKEVINKQASLSTTQKEKDDLVQQTVETLTGKYIRYLVKYNPAPILAQVQCPVLALNGENDIQVSADENLNMIQHTLLNAGNQNVTIKKLPGLNHLFQTSQTGSIKEYGEIEETFSQETLEIMLNWLKEQVRK